MTDITIPFLDTAVPPINKKQKIDTIKIIKEKTKKSNQNQRKKAKNKKRPQKAMDRWRGWRDAGRKAVAWVEKGRIRYTDKPNKRVASALPSASAMLCTLHETGRTGKVSGGKDF